MPRTQLVASGASASATPRRWPVRWCRCLSTLSSPTPRSSTWRSLRGQPPMPAEVTDEDVFLEVGCGMGLVLLDAARLPFRRVVGVDVVPQFTDAAKQLLDRNRSLLRCREFEVTTADVLDYEIPDDATVVYLN